MTQKAEIRFGTDGWRALIAEDYTYENVARCAQGLCDYMRQRGTADRGLIVGYDTRFLSPEFAATVAGVAASQGIRTLLADRSAPTPVLSYNVLHHSAGARPSLPPAITRRYGTASSSSPSTQAAPPKKSPTSWRQPSAISARLTLPRSPPGATRAWWRT